jgi:hypothetical protein
MKKLLATMLMSGIIFAGQISANAVNNVLPRYVNYTNIHSLGVYEVNDRIILYKEPNETSAIVMSYIISKSGIFPENTREEDLFAVFIPKKELALMTVVDENEDWVQVVYDNKTGASAWLKKDDPYKFMTWIHFYNMYGRKYGLYQLKDTPNHINTMRSAAKEDSQSVGELNHPEKINLNVINGNWALVSVKDLDRMPKTGFVRWRADNGIRYFFPDIK